MLLYDTGTRMTTNCSRLKSFALMIEGHVAPQHWYLHDYKLWQTQTEILIGHAYFCKLAFFTGLNDYITNNNMLLEG